MVRELLSHVFPNLHYNRLQLYCQGFTLRDTLTHMLGEFIIIYTQLIL